MPRLIYQYFPRRSMYRSAYLFNVLLILPFGYILSELDFNKNYLIVFIHMILGFISIKIIKKRDYGMLNQAAGVFFLIFFAIFPIYEFSKNIIYWDGVDFSSELRFLGAFTVFIFVFLYWVTLKITFRSNIKGHAFIHEIFAIYVITTRKIKWFYISSIIGIILLFNLYEFQILALFVKGGEFGEGLNVDSKASYLFVEFFLRPLLFNICLAFVLLCPTKNIYKLFFIIIMIFSASPSGVSRFLVAALYLPLILIMILRQRNKNEIVLSENYYLLPNILLFGIFFLFPLLEVFRDFYIEKFNNFSFYEYQLGGSFDAFQMFLRALELGSVSYGYGFIGVLLFFIPRSIWPSKPLTSGIEISQLANLRLENVSMPIIGELYLNFWYFGIIFGAPLLAMFFKQIDWYYLKYKNSHLSLGHLVYFQLVGLVIYNFRGGLLSSFAYTVSILITWLIILFMIDPKNTH